MWVSRCDRVRPRLPLLAGGELIGPERRQVERHLIRCAACRRRLAGLRDAMDVLHAGAALDPVGGPSPSPSLWPDLARQLRESRRAGPTWDRPDPRALAKAGATLAAACLLGVIATLSYGPVKHWLWSYRVELVLRPTRPPARHRQPPLVQRVTYKHYIRELPPQAGDDAAPTSRPDEPQLARYPAADARSAEPTH